MTTAAPVRYASIDEALGARDGNLTREQTLFSFLRFHLAAVGHPPGEYDARRGRLAALTGRGVPRAVTNRAYVENWVGADVAVVSEVARAWFATAAGREGFWNGAEKARAVTRIAARLGVAPGECESVGDHSSDRPMLLATGTAVVVGDDELVARAAAAGWARLPGGAWP